jgi:NitT/TauT family transport system ATP-binding protein
MAHPPLLPGVAACSIVDQPGYPVRAETKPIVELRNVTKTYEIGTRREFTAIRDVTFAIDDLDNIGEFVCLLGPSGCGKSTVLRLIAGLAPHFPATSGDVLLNGAPVAKPGPDRGMVFQDYTAFDNRTVLDNVAFGLECRGVARAERHEEARQWIARVGLDPGKDALKYPHQLSGGMRQRVAIARTLILKPKVILMDEPFGALDPVTRRHMQDLLVQLWHEVEATVFFVTHDVDEAVLLGDRVFIFGNSPGTIQHRLFLMPADQPAKLMMREKAFQDSVFHIRDILDGLQEGKD